MRDVNMPRNAMLRPALTALGSARSTRAMGGVVSLVLCCVAPACAQSTSQGSAPAPATVASTTVPVPGRCEEARTGPQDAVGCYRAGTESFGVAPDTPLFWHLDRYATRADAESARRAHGTVVEAHGAVWLFTLADSAWRATTGEHIARVGPLPVTSGRTYSAHYLDGVVPPGARTPVHRHAGPEAWYVVAGAQCLETPEGTRVVRAGESYVIREGPPMLLATTGAVTRRTFGLVLHDAAQPWTIPTSEWTPKGSCPP
jgi:quercetin dioxygenase-like cupin family protein